MTKNSYEIVISPLSEEDGGGFIAQVPDLFGCMADGETREEAAANIADAVEAWKLAVAKDGKEIPEPGAARAAFELRDQKVVEALEGHTELIEAQQKLIDEQSKMLASLRDQVRQQKNVTPTRVTLTGGWHSPVASDLLMIPSKTGRTKAVKVAG